MDVERPAVLVAPEAEVGYQDLALEYFLDSIYVDLGDLHSNAADGVHVASAGGVWTALVSGFGGMRDHYGALSFDPRLPRDWPSLEYTLHWQGTRLDIVLTAEAMTVTAGEGDAVDFSVRGRDVRVAGGETVTVPLAGQGPLLSGRPSLRQLSESRREDGSLLSASVPAATVTTSIPTITTEIPAITGEIPVVQDYEQTFTGQQTNVGVDS